jgi:hypothetical protein
MSYERRSSLGESGACPFSARGISLSPSQPHAWAVAILGDEPDAGPLEGGDEVVERSIIGQALAEFEICNRRFRHLGGGGELLLRPSDECSRRTALSCGYWHNLTLLVLT